MTSSVTSGSAARSVGLCLHKPRRRIPLEPFWMQFMRGVEDALAPRGLSLILQVVVTPEEEEATYRRWQQAGQVAGVIVADLVDQDPRIPLLRDLALPTVLLAPEQIAPDFATVSTAAGAPANAIMQHLALLGHRRVARVTGPAGFLHTGERDIPFRRAGERLGIHTSAIVSDYTAEGGADATLRLISVPERPSAIVYDNDVMAVAGLGVLRRAGLGVPEDVALVAWDDSLQCQLAAPPLTALVRDLVGYGATAAGSLLDVLDGKGVTHRTADEPVLVPRASTTQARTSPRPPAAPAVPAQPAQSPGTGAGGVIASGPVEDSVLAAGSGEASVAAG